MSYDKIINLANLLVKQNNDKEIFYIPLLLNKLQKVSELRPQDKTVGTVTTVIEKMSENNKSFISRAEFKGLYQKMFLAGTKFAEYFKDELGELPKLTAPKIAEKYEVPLETTQKSALFNNLSSILNKESTHKYYSDVSASQALSLVQSNLDNLNLKASSIVIDSGNEEFIVIRANYETPKGLTSILVPVEILGTKIAQPVVFVGNSGPEALGHNNIKKYITANSGVKLNIQSSQVLSVLSKKSDVEINSLDLAVNKIKMDKEIQSPFFADSVVGLEPYEMKENLIPVRQAGQFNTFSEKFDSPVGRANFTFGVEKVNLGREVIARNLSQFGIKQSQINVSNADEKTITYAVSVPGISAFNVPIKMANKSLLNPEVLICNGEILSFNKKSLDILATKNIIDYKAAAVASTSFSLNNNDLFKSLESAMEEDNYLKAEDILNVIMQSKNKENYKDAFKLYTNHLNKKASCNEPKVSCSMIVKSASYQEPVCGHTNLPLHKVYQDKHGVCHPNYRKNMDEQYQMSNFMNAKAFGF